MPAAPPGSSGHGHGHAHALPSAESGPPVTSAKLATWLFLASEVMFFTGLIGAYLVLKVSARPFETPEGWQTAFSLPQRHLDKWVALTNTLILIASGWFMVRATVAARDAARLQNNLALSIGLGLLFIGIKAFEWKAHLAHGFTPWANPFFGMYYVMTGMHVLHMVGGLVPMTAALGTSLMGGKVRPQTMELLALYWAFVDVVWIFLFPLLYLVP
jgi:heme/copper-type cytochrome/quinol oxidase subunit 3